jgi:hypothetical protein
MSDDSITPEGEIETIIETEEVDVDGETVTALVLLATPEAVILDPCDGTMPMVFRPAQYLAGSHPNPRCR